MSTARKGEGGSGALWLAALALLVQALLPGGYMLTPATAAGLPGIVFCSGWRATESADAMHQERPGALSDTSPDVPAPQAGGPCAFAMPGPAMPEDAPSFATPFLTIYAPFLPSTWAIGGCLGPASPLPPSTAPPVTL